MEEKIMFPCGRNDGQKVNEKALTDESLREVSGGMVCLDGWDCCGLTWEIRENCGKCGAKCPYYI